MKHELELGPMLLRAEVVLARIGTLRASEEWAHGSMGELGGWWLGATAAVCPRRLSEVEHHAGIPCLRATHSDECGVWKEDACMRVLTTSRGVTTTAEMAEAAAAARTLACRSATAGMGSAR